MFSQRQMPSMFLAIAFVAGAGWIPSVQAQEAAQDDGPQAVRYLEVAANGERGWRSVDAKVEAVRDSWISAQVAGAVVSLSVKAGDQVAAGQELLRIDARMASQAQQAGQAQVAAAQAQRTVAEQELRRQEQLFAKKYISQAALDAARAQYRASDAQVRALTAQTQAAQTQTALHRVQAPYAGVVAAVPVALGDMAMPGKPLLQLYDPTQLRISAQLTQQQVDALRRSGSVQVEIAGLSPERQSIALDQVQFLPTADALSHTVQVRVALPAWTGAAPGMFARLLSQGEATSDGTASLWLPLGVVVRRAEMTGVYVEGANGLPQLRQVRLGPVQGERVQVLSGVSAGDRVAEQPHIAAKVR